MVASGKTDKVKPPVFTALELARGWRILREHLQISVDLENRTLSGAAHFTFSAINNQFVSIALNLRRCRVTSCRVNGIDASYRLISPLDDNELLAAVSHRTARHRIDDIEFSMQIRDNAANTQGELVIDLPAIVSADIIDELKEILTEYRISIGKEKDIDEEIEPDAAIPVPLNQLPLVSLTVEYETLDPTAGAICYGDLSARKPVLDPLYMLTDSRFGMARFWMPCLDTINWCDRYLFDLDVAVKPNLLVVASGELVDTVQYESPVFPHSKMFKYRLHAPAHASEIVVAVGPFIALPDPTLSSKVTHFCLPGLAKELVYTAPPIFAKSLAFCREYLGGDPPSCSFKQLFVGSQGLRADVTRAGAGGIVVHSGDLLHTARCIDEGLIAREAVMNGLVMSYFGRFLRPRIAEDDWLISGLAAHVAALGLQAILGSNWYRFRISDLMTTLCAEESCDLSNTKTRQLPDGAVDAVRRRSHIIVYMIERRIGSEVMKRALRDIVAEGKSATIAAVKVICSVLSKSQQISHGNTNGCRFESHREPEARDLTNFNGELPSPSGTTSVVSTGFEDAIQGVGVGPFLKRIRAIVGTDVRGMVRLWAASRGVPRLRVGYQYNARKHAIEFAVKQEGVIRGDPYSGRPGLPFTGSVNIRVMEIEGVYDHNIEISDPLFSTELPCHSRRAKTTKPAVPGEKDVSDSSRGSPVLWIRLDPENDWCLDYTFPQMEDSWIALLKGERDAMAQYEACKGLCFSDEASAKALCSIAGDDMIYWRVRVEAAKSLASSEKGLEMLLGQFRSSYMDGDEGLLRACNFSDIAKYFVKRGFISAIAGARVKTPSSNNPVSIPVAATKFLPYLLSGHDNTGNPYDDDHYLVDLLQAAATAAVYCIGDEAHANAGEDGASTTESIVRQLERFRSIEAMIPRRTDLVKSGISSALITMEIATMMRKDAKNGSMSAAMLSGRFEHNSSLTANIFELCDRHISFGSRLMAVSDLVRIYGGDLNVFMWVLARIDTTSSGEDIIEIEWSQRIDSVQYGYCEPPAFRYQLMDAMIEAAATKGWGKSAPPLVLALRRHTSRAMKVCVRLLRLIVGEADPRIRSSALRLAKTVWGAGIPVCLLGRAEYVEAKNLIRIDDGGPPKPIVPLKQIEGFLPPQAAEISDNKATKPTKVAKSSKHGKTGKIGRTSVKLVSSVQPHLPSSVEPGGLLEPSSTVISLDGATQSAAGVKSKPFPKAPRIPKSVPKPEVITVDPISLPNLRSVPLAVSRERSRPRTSFPWDPLDEEDVKFLKRAWQERNMVGHEEGRSFEGVGHRYEAEVLSDSHIMTGKDPDGHERRTDYHDLPLPQDGAEYGSSRLDEHRKKKKKKKRKRHHDDESGHKKKKKKKKRRDDNGEQVSVDQEGQQGLEEPPPEMRKIGKFKIRLGGGSLPHVAKSE